MSTLTASRQQQDLRTSHDERNEIVLQYLPLVRFIAHRVATGYGMPYGMEIADLVSYGVIGLVDAHERFEPERGYCFETFATPRIRGAIIDELRRNDWVPRNVRTRARKLNEASSALAAVLGRTPTRDELAQELGCDLDSYERTSSPPVVVGIEALTSPASGQSAALSFAETFADPSGEAPGEAIEDGERKQQLVEALASLQERDRLILTLYYFENVQLAEIARLLKVTESRVSQLHTRALESLRGKLADA